VKIEIWASSCPSGRLGLSPYPLAVPSPPFPLGSRPPPSFPHLSSLSVFLTISNGLANQNINLSVSLSLSLSLSFLRRWKRQRLHKKKNERKKA
jgi:hypothetical protein